MMYSASNFFPSMQDKKIDVIGLGVSNTELVFRLTAAGAQVTARDKHEEAKMRPSSILRLREAGATLKLGPDYLEDLDGEIIFRTPGMSFNAPELIAAREQGRIVTSELEIFMELCPCQTFGITGSDGKTTTASLLAEMLKKTGRAVHLGGNIGKPLLPILDRINPNDLCVIELSSFQLISMRSSPDVAVLTNITPNHLDVHKDMQEYINAKLNVLTHQDAFSRAVISADCALAAEHIPLVRGRLSMFSRRDSVQNGAWMNESGDILHSIGGRSVKLLNRSDVLLPGVHNIENILAAVSAAWGVVSPKDIATVIKTFGGVEHRIEFIREKDEVRWYNDSIATTPTRTIAGLVSFEEKLIVILGGYDKLIPFDALARPLIERTKAVILTGATADKIELAIVNHPAYKEGFPKILHANDLKDAVTKAYSLADAGDVVTLSPACASFDSYQNFEERGRCFKELVQAL